MTIKELIEKLKSYDEDLEVISYQGAIDTFEILEWVYAQEIKPRKVLVIT